MRSEGQTNMTVLTVAFRNFSKAPKIYVGFEVLTQKSIILLFSLTSIELQAIERLRLFTPGTLYFLLWLENLIRSCSNSFLRYVVLIFLLVLVHDKLAYESCWHTCGMCVVLSLVLQQQEACPRL